MKIASSLAAADQCSYLWAEGDLPALGTEVGDKIDWLTLAAGASALDSCCPCARRCFSISWGARGIRTFRCSPDGQLFIPAHPFQFHLGSKRAARIRSSYGAWYGSTDTSFAPPPSSRIDRSLAGKSGGGYSVGKERQRYIGAYAFPQDMANGWIFARPYTWRYVVDEKTIPLHTDTPTPGRHASQGVVSLFRRLVGSPRIVLVQSRWWRREADVCVCVNTRSYRPGRYSDEPGPGTSDSLERPTSLLQSGLPVLHTYTVQLGALQCKMMPGPDSPFRSRASGSARNSGRDRRGWLGPGGGRVGLDRERCERSKLRTTPSAPIGQHGGDIKQHWRPASRPRENTQPWTTSQALERHFRYMDPPVRKLQSLQSSPAR